MKEEGDGDGNKVREMVKKIEQGIGKKREDEKRVEPGRKRVSDLSRMLSRHITASHILNAKYAEQKIEIKLELKRMEEKEETYMEERSIKVAEEMKCSSESDNETYDLDEYDSS
ncbi:hypothetical protein ECANGB1_794 [Enterospora canceri]|uniref:Uncharacterized protein n=1 Tax=Enterospora canceri TaxID=1081671 RepID=A0A1Y1S7H1_9MICR|nr:hypothetical protein ECANGB1_794 [Enterospora canceri]